MALGVAITSGIWLVVLLASLGVGTAMAVGSTINFRIRLWMGLSLIMLTGAAVSLVSTVNASMLLRLVVAVSAIAGAGVVVLAWRRQRSGLGSWLVIGATGAVVTLMAAWMALGEVRNYDTGLYHLQLIALAAVDGVQPGLAQLHDRFGFTSSLWPLGAQFEIATGPAVGFRLIAGLFLIALILEVTARLTSRPGRILAGTWLIVAGSVVLVAYGFSYAGRTFAGIGQDWVVAVLWLVATAYLTDWMQSRRKVDLAAAIVISTLAGSVRPFGWLLFAGVLAVAVVWRRTEVRSVGAMWWASILAGMWLVVTFTRDVLASGWFLFPLGIFPVPVQWRVADPEPTSEAVRLWARAPFDMELAASGWDWFPGWATRILTDWVVVWFLFVVTLSVVVLIGRLRATASDEGRWGTVLVAPVAIQIVALGAWFYVAPDPRFGWGPILALGGLLIVAAGGPVLVRWLAERWRWLIWLPLVVVLSSFVFSVVRDPGWWFDRDSSGSPIAVVPLPVAQVEIRDGVARTIGPDDRCWRTVVPCVPWYADPS